jgi:RHS repeat-associated protein
MRIGIRAGSFQWLGALGRLALLTAFLGAGFGLVRTANGQVNPASQPKTCNYAGGPTCPAAPPIVSGWTWTTDPFYAKPLPNGQISSPSDVDYYYNRIYTAGRGAWCGTAPYTKTEGANEWGTVPGYTDGIYSKDSYSYSYFVDAFNTDTPPCMQNWTSYVNVLKTRTISCPYGQTLTYQSSPVIGPYCAPSANSPPKALGAPCKCTSADSGSGATIIGDPVDVSDGNAYYEETDYSGGSASPLEFRRSFNAWISPIQYWLGAAAFQTGPELLGSGWTATYFQSLAPISVTDSTGTTRSAVYAFRPDGRILTFNLYSGVYSPDGDTADSLLQTSTGWEYQTADDTIEVYNTQGQLQSIARRGQAPVTLTYTAVGNQPLSASDAFGHTLTFNYAQDATGVQRLAGITDPAGATISFSYGSTGTLISTTHQDGTSRSYAYGSGAFAHSITSVTDETGNVYENWSYLSGDTSQRVGSVSLASGVGTYSFSYSTSGTGGHVSVTDPLGQSRTYNQQLLWGTYHMTSCSAPGSGCGNDSARTYDANGNMSSRTDFNGVQTRYSYDVTRNLETSRTEAYGTAAARTLTTAWDPNWRQPDTVTEPNRTTAFTHDSLGNVLTKTVTDTTTSNTRTWTYTYDSYGRILTAKGPRTDLNSTTTYTYNTCTTGYGCGELSSVTDAVGNVTTYNTYNAHGQPLTMTDPNGVVTTLTYDARLRLASRQVGTETTAFSYYASGLLKRVTLPDASYVQYTYDTSERLVQIADNTGNYINYTLDAMGNRTAQRAYDPSATLHLTHSRVFNSLSQLYQDINAAGTAAVTTTYGYDSNGNQTSIAAPLSRNTGNVYDQLSRLVQVTDPASGVTHFGYDANDNLVSVQDPKSLTTSYSYDGFGDLLQQVSPDTGTTTSSYDSAGNLSISTDARGASANYTYDALNRPTQIVYKNAGVTDQTLVFQYDSGTNGKGRLTGAGDGNHTMSWTYDTLGRVTGKGQTVGTVAQSMGYAYTNGDLTGEVTPSGQSISYSYNSNHQVVGISVNGTSVLTGVTYEPFGGVNGWTWGNAATEARTYNTDGLISQIVGASATYGYAFDNANRITGISDSSNSALSWSYGYDALDRLTSASTSSVTDGWTYDANGNRLSQTGTAASTYTVTTGSNRLASVSGALNRTYTYSAAGAATGFAGNTFTYNNRGRMLGVATGSGTTGYLYNALGQMVEKAAASPTNLYMYDESGHLLGEYDGSGNLIEETVWLGDIPVATLQPNGSGGINVFYIHSDHLNTAKKISRPSDNALVWRIDQDPFGTTVPNQNPSGLGTFVYNPRLPGQLFMAETGLNYNYSRDYDPQTGRYVEPDPIGQLLFFNLSNVSGVSMRHRGYWNQLYAYVDDDPTRLRDPSGLGAFDWLWDWFKDKTPEEVTNKSVAASLAALCITRNCGKSRDSLELYGDCATELDKLIKAQGKAIIFAIGGIAGDGGQAAISECAELCGKGIKAGSCCKGSKQ